MLFRDRPENLFDDAKSEDADENQIERDDVVQKARHDQNKNAGNERNDGLKMAECDGHRLSPFMTATKFESQRIRPAEPAS